MQSPRVSAIVLNYRSPRDTLKCIATLLKQTIINDLEILVVDNHSSDESIQWIRNRYGRHPNVRIVEIPENIGYGQGNDLAIRMAEGEFILIINPDNELQPDGLERMVTAMERDKSIGILSPKLTHPDGTIRDSARQFPGIADVFLKRTFLHRFFPERVDRYLQAHEDPNRVRAVDWVAGACILFRKDLYEKLGGFDPQFFLFFEDTDLCRRMWATGKKVVYFPLVSAQDSKRRLSAGGLLSLLTKKTMRIHAASALKYFWKWRKSDFANRTSESRN